jgi:LAO/AO transport system kinase
MTCSAREKNNIESIWGMISSYQIDAVKNKEFYKKRSRQNRQWMQKLIFEMVDLKLKKNPRVRSLLPELEKKVEAGEMTPFIAAKTLVDLL